MSRNRMMAEVAEADVLLVNPTHYAVALKYDPAKGAPRVVAKGAGEVAAKLREVASDARMRLVGYERTDTPMRRRVGVFVRIVSELDVVIRGDRAPR